MRGGGDREEHFHIPLQIIQRGTHASDFFYRQRMIGHFIGQNVPVAGRGLRVGSIRPEFRQNSHKITPFHEVGLIRPTGDFIDRVTFAIIASRLFGTTAQVAPACKLKITLCNLVALASRKYQGHDLQQECLIVVDGRPPTLKRSA